MQSWRSSTWYNPLVTDLPFRNKPWESATISLSLVETGDTNPFEQKQIGPNPSKNGGSKNAEFLGVDWRGVFFVRCSRPLDFTPPTNPGFPMIFFNQPYREIQSGAPTRGRFIWFLGFLDSSSFPWWLFRLYRGFWSTQLSADCK